MKNISLPIILIILLSITLSSCHQKELKTPDNEQKIENLISKLSLQEKIKMLSGTGFDTPGIDRLSIPGLMMTDGPAGVRWGKSTAFPGPISLAASWNNNLVYRIGQAMAKEVKLKSKNVLLAPCVNIYRFPLGGRNFESYGEDPYLTSQTGLAIIKGIQKEKVIATVKHFAANNQEWERFRVNTKVQERPLREIYLPAFKTAVQEAHVYSVMAAYNKVNGHYCSANKYLLTDILKDEWGFDGYVVSDWGATHHTIDAANAGLDIEMPRGKHFSDSLLMAVQNKKVTEATINDKVRRILRIMYRSGLMNPSHDPLPEATTVYEEHKSLALEAAEKGMVLLKNEQNILPLKIDKNKTIAVIGPNAAYAISGGGGSSMVRPFYTVSPLKGIKDYIGHNMNILYASGPAMDGDILPIDSKYMHSLDKLNFGFSGEYFRLEDFSAKPVFTRVDHQINFNFGYNAPESELDALDDGNKYAIRWTGLLKAPKTGLYNLKIQCDGGIRLFIDDKVLFEDMDNIDVKLRSAEIQLQAKQYYKIKIEYVSSWGVSEIKFGWDIPDVNLINEAVAKAKEADICILVTGLSNHFESESGDLKHFHFPKQDEFINAVLATNPNTVVVMYNGSQYSIKKWAKNTPAILEAWYGGQEQGNALARVLFGDYNPSGKLPYSILADSTDCPAFADYQSPSLISNYDEGIFVGYRYLEKNDIKPLFPFGHGLSYTSFLYSNLQTKTLDNGHIELSLKVKNTGEYAGTETIQCYISDLECSVPRPIKELKAFQQLHLEAGEESEVLLLLKQDAFAFYDVKSKSWMVEAGEFKILIGSSVEDIRLESLIKK